MRGLAMNRRINAAASAARHALRQRIPRLCRKTLVMIILPALSAYAERIEFTASAQTSQPARLAEADGLTLPLAIEIALKTNPLLRATLTGKEVADARVEEARASRWPLLQFNETFARGNNPVFVFGSLLEQGRFGTQNFDLHPLNNPDALNNYRTSLSLRMPLLDQKEAGTQISQARIGQKQADLQRQVAEQQVRFDVVRTYYGVLMAQAKYEVAEEAVHLAEADVKRIRDMFDTGTVVRSDLLAAEVQLAEFRQQNIQAEGDLTIANAALNTALGVAIDTPQKITGLLTEKNFEVDSTEQLIRTAIANRPEFERAKLSTESSRERLRETRGQYWPRLDLFGNFGLSSKNLSTGSSDYTFGASLTFNIFDAGRAARVHQAIAAEAIASAEQEHLLNEIRFEVVRAYQQFGSARERVAVAARVVEQAREALRIVQDRYHEGLTTITESLRAETTFIRARMMLLAARYDHYTGFAALLLASGRLTDVQPFVS